MQKWWLNPYERLVIRVGAQYKLAGPGTVWVFPLFEEVLAKLHIGVTGHALEVYALSTAEGIQVDIEVQLLYKIEPELLERILCQVIALNDGGWQTILNWRIEYTLRKLVSQYSWQDISRPMIQKRVERQLSRIVSDDMASVGINVSRCCLVKVKLPDDLLEAQLQSAVLKSYTTTFGAKLPQAMSDIARLQLLTSMQQEGRVQVILTSSDFSNAAPAPNGTMYYLPLG